jgi:hypothetical protein
LRCENISKTVVGWEESLSKYLEDAMINRQTGWILFVVGLALALLSIVIDPLRDLDVYLATEQIIALIVGIAIALAGLYLLVTRRSTPPTPR